MTNAYSDEEKLVDATGNANIQQQIGLEYRDSGDLERNALLSLMEQNITRAKIPLRFDMMVGQTVSLFLPSNEIDLDDENADKLEGHTYLIGKLTYEISPVDGYGEVTMQCIKESFEEDIATYQPDFLAREKPDDDKESKQPDPNTGDFGTGFDYGIS